MIPCGCTIAHAWMEEGWRCDCDCHSELTPDEQADLAILASRIEAGAFADDRKPMTYTGWGFTGQRQEYVTPWHIALEVE